MIGHRENIEVMMNLFVDNKLESLKTEEERTDWIACLVSEVEFEQREFNESRAVRIVKSHIQQTYPHNCRAIIEELTYNSKETKQ